MLYDKSLKIGGEKMNNFHSKPNTFVNHVHLKVENLSRSLEFIKT